MPITVNSEAEFLTLCSAAIAAKNFEDRDPKGRNLLHLAVQFLLAAEAHKLIINSLESGVDLRTQKDNDDRTPGYYAKIKGLNFFATAVDNSAELDKTWMLALEETEYAHTQKQLEDMFKAKEAKAAYEAASRGLRPSGKE